LWELLRNDFRARGWRERFDRVFAPPGREPQPGADRIECQVKARNPTNEVTR